MTIAPLEGIRVVDLTRVLAGPFGTTILGDLGAEVIKVEPTDGGDPTRAIAPYVNGQSHYFLSLNRNKKSIAVDIKSEPGRGILRKLISSADVLVENFRPGVLAGLGFDPIETLAAYPSLIICSISGFGQTGPMRDKPSFDLVTQALSGAMSLTGEPGRPPVRMGIPLGDLIGGLYGSIATLAALRERSLTGAGTHIDLSLHDSLVSLLGYVAARYFATGEVLGPVGSGHHTSVPYRAYEAADGFIVVACMMDAFWPKLCEAIGRPELADDPRLATYDQRTAERESIDNLMAEIIRTGSVSEWSEVFEAADIPYAPILDVPGVIDHPQTVHRGMVREFNHPVYGAFKTLKNPIRFVGHGPGPLSPPPVLGEHTDQVLEELGFSPEEILQFRKQGVVG